MINYDKHSIKDLMKAVAGELRKSGRSDGDVLQNLADTYIFHTNTGRVDVVYRRNRANVGYVLELYADYPTRGGVKHRKRVLYQPRNTEPLPFKPAHIAKAILAVAREAEVLKLEQQEHEARREAELEAQSQAAQQRKAHVAALNLPNIHGFGVACPSSPDELYVSFCRVMTPDETQRFCAALKDAGF